MNTSFIALGVSVVVVLGLVFSLFGLSLLIGAVESLFGRPKLTFLKSSIGQNGFAFWFDWNESKEPARFNTIKIRLFNPFGSPKQLDLERSFEAQSSSFGFDLDFGHELAKLKAADAKVKARVMVEVFSALDGITHQYEMSLKSFLDNIAKAEKSLDEFKSKLLTSKEENEGPQHFNVKARSFVVDTVPGKGPKLKLATNPEFVGEFKDASGGHAAPAGGGAPASNAANFNITKVWIAPGCIVCNACETIYPEVFHVTAETCIIKPNPPLDNGLKIQEAAEACPVEVIKYTKA